MTEIILRVHDDAVKTVVDFLSLCLKVEVVSCSQVRKKTKLTDEILAVAVMQCQDLFWAASAWGVVYRLVQSDYNEERSMDRFEKDMGRRLPHFKKKCKDNAVQLALINNPVLKEKPRDWEGLGASKRIILLRDALKHALDNLLS